MEIVPIKIIHGEDKAWQRVCDLDKADVSRRTTAPFDKEAGAYILNSFGVDYHVNPCDMLLSCATDEGAGADGGGLMLGKLKDFFRLSVLWYMTSAKDIPTTGKLIRPVDVKGGHRFSAGTHVLPLDAIAARFARDPEGFIRQGQRFGAEVSEGYGDAYITLYPLPRVPVSMILWLEDDEFPPKVDLFFDSTCELQLDLSDIVWAVAIMCSLVMLEQ